VPIAHVSRQIMAKMGSNYSGGVTLAKQQVHRLVTGAN
jgi:hypothetical protein